jgi:hypothetical protein
MSLDQSNHHSSRRQFLEATTAGAIGFSTGMLSGSVKAASTSPASKETTVGTLSIVSKQSIRKGSTGDLHLRFHVNVDLKPGAKLWLFFDIRQGALTAQTDKPDEANFLSITSAGHDGSLGTVQLPAIPRTFDLLPTAPEFLHLIELTLDRQVAAGSNLDFVIHRWTGPGQPIDPYKFWLVVDHDAQWDFVPIGFRRYRKFVRRGEKHRIDTKDLLAHTAVASLKVNGEYEAVPKISHRKTPGVFWGEFHGMVFNQRPLDDYYNYAKHVAQLDFCAPFGFSYNTSVGDVWDDVKVASRRHSKSGKFVAIAGFECGTPPDGSHRCVLFRDPEKVPPIFCEDRPPAQEPFFQKRLHPDTIVCKTTAELYETVAKFGGMITGHFHTRTYHKEVLCEMFQKNLTKPADEEERLYELLRAGQRFALAGTSDTHDSMPGNPKPEPHLTMAAGFTGVHAKELTIDALFDAVLARRIYATSGARIFMNFHSNDRPMGTELPLNAKRQFQLKIDGTAELSLVELLRDGRPVQKWSPGKNTFSITAEDSGFDDSQSAFYHVRVTQTDTHKGWTSPIWFG